MVSLQRLRSLTGKIFMNSKHQERGGRVMIDGTT